MSKNNMEITTAQTLFQAFNQKPRVRFVGGLGGGLCIPASAELYNIIK